MKTEHYELKINLAEEEDFNIESLLEAVCRVYNDYNDYKVWKDFNHSTFEGILTGFLDISDYLYFKEIEIDTDSPILIEDIESAFEDKIWDNYLKIISLFYEKYKDRFILTSDNKLTLV